MQISMQRLGQGVEVGPFVQNHIWSKSFLGMDYNDKKCSFMWIEIPVVLTQGLEGK